MGTVSSTARGATAGRIETRLRRAVALKRQTADATPALGMICSTTLLLRERWAVAAKHHGTKRGTGHRVPVCSPDAAAVLNDIQASVNLLVLPLSQSGRWTWTGRGLSAPRVCWSDVGAAVKPANPNARGLRWRGARSSGSVRSQSSPHASHWRRKSASRLCCTSTGGPSGVQDSLRRSSRRLEIRDSSGQSG